MEPLSKNEVELFVFFNEFRGTTCGKLMVKEIAHISTSSGKIKNSVFNEFNIYVSHDNVKESHCTKGLSGPSEPLLIQKDRINAVSCRKVSLSDSDDCWVFTVAVLDEVNDELGSGMIKVRCNRAEDEGCGTVPLNVKNLGISLQLEYHYLAVYALPDSVLSAPAPPTPACNPLEQVEPDGRPLLIGHRGMGHSVGVTEWPENTLKSFLEAARLGLDMIETDLHWTADQQLVLFHNFRYPNDVEKDPMIRDLSYDDLMKLNPAEQPEAGTEIPLFRDVMTQVPVTLAMNLEIKYPSLQENGKWCSQIESEKPEEYYMRKNLCVDGILKEVLELAGSRQIVLSCFNSEIALLLRLKQPHYPVLYITRGGICRVPGTMHVDRRCSSLSASVAWAKVAGLQGVVSYAERWIHNPQDIGACKENGLSCMAYGVGVTSDSFITFARMTGITGLFVDEVEEAMKIFQISVAENGLL